VRVPRVDERTLSVCLYIKYILHEHDVRTSTRVDTAQPRIYACTDPRDSGTGRIHAGIRARASAPLLSLLCAVSFLYADGFSSVKEIKKSKMNQFLIQN
jgi:hypothetical protein